MTKFFKGARTFAIGISLLAAIRKLDGRGSLWLGE